MHNNLVRCHIKNKKGNPNHAIIIMINFVNFAISSIVPNLEKYPLKVAKFTMWRRRVAYPSRGGNFEIDLENGKEGGHFVGARLPTSSPSLACQISRIRARGGVGSAVYQVIAAPGRSAADRGPPGAPRRGCVRPIPGRKLCSSRGSCGTTRGPCRRPRCPRPIGADWRRTRR